MSNINRGEPNSYRNQPGEEQVVALDGNSETAQQAACIAPLTGTARYMECLSRTVTSTRALVYSRHRLGCYTKVHILSPEYSTQNLLSGLGNGSLQYSPLRSLSGKGCETQQA